MGGKRQDIQIDEGNRRGHFVQYSLRVQSALILFLEPHNSTRSEAQRCTDIQAAIVYDLTLRLIPALNAISLRLIFPSLSHQIASCRYRRNLGE